jgi:ribosomal protein S25
MNSYSSVFDICANNKVLKQQIKQLENEILNLKELNSRQACEIKKLQEQNEILKEVVDARNEENAPEILEYFHSNHSIRRTAWAYGMEMEELYELIPQWEDCRDGLKSADDYKECRIEVIGRREYDEEQEDDMTKEYLEFRQRELDADEVKQIIDDYKESSNLTLYELADRYELQINYLFKLLKENKVIDKETDAKGYANFYEEYYGAGCEWDGKSDLGLLE